MPSCPGALSLRNWLKNTAFMRLTCRSTAVADHGSNRSPQKLCEQLISELLDYLGLQRIAIVGTSMGAGVSIGYALNNPCTVTRLVLAAAGGIASRRGTQLGMKLIINLSFVLTTAAGYFARKPGAF